jgi:phosphatidylglycerophosphate synthase
LIKTALITAPGRGGEIIFRRPLLERLMLNCERAGIRRFFIQASPEEHGRVSRQLGRFADRQGVTIVGAFDELVQAPSGLEPSEPCVRLDGNLVLSTWSLERIFDRCGKDPRTLTETLSADSERGGMVLTGPLASLVRTDAAGAPVSRTARDLPFALNGRPEDRDEAEVRLGRTLKLESEGRDAPFARYLDRHLSWRISIRLARTGIRANHVTIANTALGLVSACMFASASYWIRLLASLLFLFSIVVDGVDGELARLTMTESKFGGLLDTITDNVVHVAMFAGILWGCYRVSGSIAYIYLIPILLGGFGLCAIATYRAMHVDGKEAERWLSMVDRVSGRDFAYLLVVLAAIDRLSFFAWGAAAGTYVFALILFWMTHKRLKRGEAGTEGA